MKTLLCILTTFALAGIAPSVASAADLGRGYYEGSEAYVERPVPPVRVERRYYEPDYYYDDAPVVTYYRRPYPYYCCRLLPLLGSAPRLLAWRLGSWWLGASRLGTSRSLVSFRKSFGDPGVIRTRDLRFRKPLLYPAELRGQALRRAPDAASRRARKLCGAHCSRSSIAARQNCALNSTPRTERRGAETRLSNVVHHLKLKMRSM